MSRQRGFTAAEMTVATGLASLLMGLTLVTVEGTAREWRVREASSTLATTLRAARLQAVTEGTTVGVVFNPVTATYAVIAEPAGGSTPPGPHDVKLPKGVAFTAPSSGSVPGPALVGFSDEALVFSARGRIIGATPPAYVHIGDSGAGSFRRVRVNLAGVVTIERWLGDGLEVIGPAAAAPPAAERGMLYVELLGAIALLGMVIAGIAGMSLTAARENASSGDLTTSATLARDRAEQLTGIPYPALTAGTVLESLRDRGKLYERVTRIETDTPHPGMKTVTVTVEPKIASRHQTQRRITVQVYRVP